MKPTRGNSSPAWCSTFATTRRAVVHLSAWSWKLLYRTSGLRLGRPAGRNQDVGELPLEILVGRDADRVLDAACLQRLVDLRPREGGVGPERDALSLGLLAVDLGHEQFLPVVRAGDVARSQLGRQTVAVIAEQKRGW